MDEYHTIFTDDWSPDHRSGIVAVVGRPNVGKSTLINAILGQKIAIVTPKPQTTRNRQPGIYTEKDAQLIFVDTPGIHKARNKLGEYMTTVWEEALKDADVILWILDASVPPQEDDHQIAELIQETGGETPVVLALNKADLRNASSPDQNEYERLIPHNYSILLSALNGDAVPELIANLKQLLPPGPRYYPADQLSDVNMRFIAAEVVREKIILLTEQEIPHSVAVEITDFKEKEQRASISAIIYVERESQKGIMIGKGGKMIKRIGTEARLELERILETPVYLELYVKVLKNWRSNEALMKRLGYRLPSSD